MINQLFKDQKLNSIYFSLLLKQIFKRMSWDEKREVIQGLLPYLESIPIETFYAIKGAQNEHSQVDSKFEYVTGALAIHLDNISDLLEISLIPNLSPSWFLYVYPNICKFDAKTLFKLIELEKIFPSKNEYNELDHVTQIKWVAMMSSIVNLDKEK